MDNNWTFAKAKFKESVFPERTVTEKCVLNPDYNSNKGEQHDSKPNTHQLQTYTLDVKVGEYLVTWKYNYCQECQKVINKYGVLLDEKENRSYVKYFVKNGKPVNGVKEVVKEKPTEIGALVDEYMSGGDLGE